MPKIFEIGCILKLSLFYTETPIGIQNPRFLKNTKTPGCWYILNGGFGYQKRGFWQTGVQGNGGFGIRSRNHRVDLSLK